MLRFAPSLRVPGRVALAAVAALALGPRVEAKSLDQVDPKVRVEVVEAARRYFDEQVSRWEGRKGLKAVQEKLAAAKDDPLRDLDLLQEILYQGRSFLEEFSDKGWQKTNDIRTFQESGPYNNLLSERLRFTYATPPTYPNKAALKKSPRPGPLPLLFVLHEEQDYTGDEKQHPGEAALKRFWPKAEFAPIYDAWMMLAPAAPRAKFVDEGTVRKEFTTDVFAQFWKRYHVDFDRVVLDGGDAALAIAAAQPVFFAGLVLRGGNVDPDVVKNFASIPVYVVKVDRLAADLKGAGHPDVTLGDAAGLPAWLAQRRRTTPTRFEWNAKRADQLLAHWVSIDNADTQAATRTISVQVDREKNRIEATADGIYELVFFLNDRIVDLDRDLEIVVNGHVERKERIARNFDFLLDREPIRIRKSMYLGWLFPASVAGVVVRPPDATAPPGEGEKPPGNGGNPPPDSDPMSEERAQKLWEKAAEAEAKGDSAEAWRLYGKVVEVGETSFKAKAEAKVRELEGKQEIPAEPDPSK